MNAEWVAVNRRPLELNENDSLNAGRKSESNVRT
jgi:hypothetical protein